MPKSRVVNISGFPIGMPYPFRGLLAASRVAVLDGDPESIIEALGGRLAIFGVLTVESTLDSDVLTPHGPNADATVEDLIVRVHPGTGIDPLVIVPQNRQTYFDSVRFKTIAAAVAAIPASVRHNVEVRIADGDWTLPATDEPFGNWRRFDIATDKRVQLRSESLSERVPGTTSYAVTGSTADAAATQGFATLTADPGFSANFLRDSFVKVVSGTGNVGLGTQRYRTISQSAAAIVTIAGAGFNPELDATSVVEFHRPAVRLTLNPAVTAMRWQGPGAKNLSGGTTLGGVYVAPFGQSMGFVGIELISASQQTFTLNDVDLDIDVAVFNNVLLRPSSGFFQPSSMVVKSTGTGTLVLQGGGFTRIAGTPNILLRNAAIGWQLFGNLTGITPTTRISGISFYDLTSHAFDVQSSRCFLFGPVSSTSRVYAINVAGHFINLLRSWFELPSGFTALPVGTAGAVNLDGVSTSYATIDAATGDTVVGDKHSVASSQ